MAEVWSDICLAFIKIWTSTFLIIMILFALKALLSDCVQEPRKLVNLEPVRGT